MPALNPAGLWPAQARAIENLEQSLRDDRPRALIQMATGAGKTFTAANVSYRLIKHADARRVLFLVDRAHLGRQTLKEFQQFTTPDDGRKFTELYNVQHLASQVIDPIARVCISTIQRMYSILKGEPDLSPDLDEASAHEIEPPAPVEVEYNPAVPIETFDVIMSKVTTPERALCVGGWRLGGNGVAPTVTTGLGVSPGRRSGRPSPSGACIAWYFVDRQSVCGVGDRSGR